MKSHLAVVAFLIVVVLLSLGPAFAGTGDPRFINRVLEVAANAHQRAASRRRGDDGVLYYVAIATARLESTVNASARVVVLGLEGRTPHEITAFGIGTGEATDGALASL